MKRFLIAGFLVAGCGGGSSSTDMSMPLDFANADFAAKSVSLKGAIVDGATMAPLVGMKVCIDSTMFCATVDMMGAYVLPGVPANTPKLLISYTLMGYPTSISEKTTLEADLVESRFFNSNDALKGIATAFGVTLDPNKSLVGINTGAAGSSATIDAKAGCAGPFYFDDKGMPAPMAKAAGATNLIAFANCSAPGDFDATVTLNGNPCPALAWPGTAPSSISMHLVAGELTSGQVKCN